MIESDSLWEPNYVQLELIKFSLINSWIRSVWRTAAESLAPAFPGNKSSRWFPGNRKIKKNNQCSKILQHLIFLLTLRQSPVYWLQIALIATILISRLPEVDFHFQRQLRILPSLFLLLPSLQRPKSWFFPALPPTVQSVHQPPSIHQNTSAIPSRLLLLLWVLRLNQCHQ